MRNLPLLLSMPHAGRRVPEEVAPYCVLTPQEIAEDSDGGATQLFGPLEAHVGALVTTDIARAIVDVNRAPDDIGKDGVFKTHTRWDVPVYQTRPPQALLQGLIARYHTPFHERLSSLARSRRFVLGVDCHTMASFGPPVGPDPRAVRPLLCLSNGDGTCSDELLETLADYLGDQFGRGNVALNRPFRGGYIVRSHAVELPWVQLELSRSNVVSLDDKRAGVLAALAAFCAAGHPVGYVA